MPLHRSRQSAADARMARISGANVDFETIWAIGFVVLRVAKLSDSPIIQRFRVRRQWSSRQWPILLPRVQFGLGEVIDAVREQVRRFAQERIAPRANEIDSKQCVPKGFVGGIRRSGFLGMTVSPGLRWCRTRYLAHTVAMEEISRRIGRRGLELWRAFEFMREINLLSMRPTRKSESSTETPQR